MEQFIQLPGRFSNYAVSIDGRVLDLVKQKEIIPTKGPNSLYIGVTLVTLDDPISKTHHLHRLIAMAFVPNNTGLKFDELQVNHKDGNKLNNDPSNLEWVTQQQNCAHAYQTGLRQDNKHIEMIDVNTGIMYETYSLSNAARILGINPSSLHGHMNTERRKYEPINGFYVSYRDHRALGINRNDWESWMSRN